MDVAIIGVGRMGRCHLQVIRALGLSLVGVCDHRVDALRAAGEEAEIPLERQYDDAAKLLSDTHPECVIVATTAPSHAPLTCLAAEAGARYIVCEKPMATSLAECDRMLQTCKRHRVKLAINHQMRFMPQYIEPKRIVNAESFGGATSVTVVGGNFGLSMNGTHYVEMFRYLTDEVPQAVTAWFSGDRIPNPRGTQFEDRAGAIRISTASGKRFYMEIGADQGHGVKEIYAGRYGQIVVDPLAGTMQVTVRQEAYRQLPTTRYGMPWEDAIHKIEPADALKPTQAVLEALLTDQDPPAGEVGRLAVAVLVAAHLSDEQGHRPVRIEEAEQARDRVFPWA